MEATKEKLRDICEMKKTLTDNLKAQMTNLETLDTKEAGEVVDMIKDLAQTEAYCWQACYYETVVKAMKEGEREPHYGESRMGYDNWRYSSGRFAPTGEGHFAGYTPHYPPETWTMPVMGYIGDEVNAYERRQGYPRTSQTGTRMNRYGHTKDGDIDMEIQETIHTMKDIWKDASPENKREMKEKVARLMEEWKEV